MSIGSKGEKTRADIVGCATRLFYELGYEATSFSDIVDASGLYRGNIYHYFKSKEDILQAVVEQRLVEFRTLLAKWDKVHINPKVRLLAFVDMITGHQSELVEYGCPIGSLNTELGKDRRDLQLAARALFDLFRDWLAVCFVELGRDAEAKTMALHLLGRAQGIAVIAHVYQDRRLLKREAGQLEAWIRLL
ncbi:MAG: TetR/AcrR family transcriptional regulator [Acidiferrobacterales bacterium]